MLTNPAITYPTSTDEDVDLPISHSVLLTESGATSADLADQDDMIFVIEEVLAGTLEDASNNVLGAGDELAKTESWTWTPPQDGNGLIQAFSIRASDGADPSQTSPRSALTSTR